MSICRNVPLKSFAYIVHHADVLAKEIIYENTYIKPPSSTGGGSGDNGIGEAGGWH